MADGFCALVERLGEAQHPYVSRGGRHTGVDSVYLVHQRHLPELLDAALEDDLNPKDAKRPRTVCAKYAEPGIQLHNLSWGPGEKAGCILMPESGGEELFVTWTSSIG